MTSFLVCLRMFSVALDNIRTRPMRVAHATVLDASERWCAFRDALHLLGPCFCTSAPSIAQETARAAHELLGNQLFMVDSDASRHGVIALADWQLFSLSTMAREACRSIRGDMTIPPCASSGALFSDVSNSGSEVQKSYARGVGPRGLVVLLSLLALVVLVMFNSPPGFQASVPGLRSKPAGELGGSQQKQVDHFLRTASPGQSESGQGTSAQVAWQYSVNLDNVTAPHLRWFGAMQGGSGYGVEATETVAALVAAGLDVSGQTIDEGEYYLNFPAITADRVVSAIRRSAPPSFVAVCHMSANLFGRRGCPPPGAKYAVGRTMWEYSSVPDKHLLPMTEVDEIWVPSIFVKQLYVASGLPEDSIIVIPEPSDVDVYDPSIVQPLGTGPPWNTYGVDVTTSPAPFRFFSMFNSESAKRKGIAETVTAFVNEFTMADNVELYLPGSFGNPIGNMLRLAESVHSTLPFEEVMRRMTRIRPYGFIPQIDMPSFYKTMDCLVLPTEGEGWGRPVSDSMAMALPVIVTGWSGESEYARPDNAFLLEFSLMDSEDHPVAPGQRIRAAKPTVASVQQAMRQVVANPAVAKEKGRKARELISRFYSGPAIAELVQRQLKRISVELATGSREVQIRQEPYPGADWGKIVRSNDFADAVNARANRSVSFNERSSIEA